MFSLFTSHIANFAHRATVTASVGLSVWGLWLTAAVWKSRRDERAIQSVAINAAGSHDEHLSPSTSAIAAAAAPTWAQEDSSKVSPPPRYPS
ncbi:hypothetical protein K437DRAFT_276343 [Tilletiaria anomala UBC 951]|uniref:Uncharacterized protein n=1 Tax=Tilletiaria anomala (strain ATCC 24038 / CBS 436.72 / UBC 951) TaxID=1037660 RepID=A0A066VD20_TILAU|nr:uncharacterized protein K437DRAFT_276343 [Tilletiaria anomala UBC 951]KDN38198.1 hypothetical protein K437DRAFT_276343 [Tilletiaria anomala UBC 951]